MVNINEDKPIYILNIEEGVLIPSEIDSRTEVVRYIIGGITVVLVLGSILFGENLFSGLGWYVRILYIGLFVRYIIFGRKRVDTPSPIDIYFYEDYLMLYRPKIYCSRNMFRKETNIMKYELITKIKYMKNERQFHIYGQVIGKHYKYLKDGMVDTVPHYDRIVDDGFVFFNTRCTGVNDEQVLDVLCRYIPNKLEVV